MTKKIVVEKTNLVLFSEDELSTQPFGTFNDNGGEPDGNLYLLPRDEIEAFEGMKVVTGYIIHGYTEPNNYRDYCGFSSRDVAYTTDAETAESIASDEYGIRTTE